MLGGSWVGDGGWFGWFWMVAGGLSGEARDGAT